MNKETKSKIISIVIGVVTFPLFYFGVQKFLKKDLESQLKEAVLEINKSAPMNVSKLSRLDSASIIGKKEFIYHYTLITTAKNQVNMDTVNKYIRPTIIENVKTNSDLKIYRDNNITLKYKYYDKNGEFAMEIPVTPELYKE